MRILGLMIVFTTLALGGCATSGAQSSDGGDRNLIASEELRELEGEGLEAWEAIRRLRSRWLRSRGNSSFTSGPATARVFVDGVEHGELNVLRSLSVTDVEEMQYLSAQDATTRFGTGYTGGAILVETR